MLSSVRPSDTPRTARWWTATSLRRAQPPIVHAPQVEAPSPEEVRAILVEAEKVEPPLATLLLLAALTGARRGELLRVAMADVDFDLRTLVISGRSMNAAGGGWAERPPKPTKAAPSGWTNLAQKRYGATSNT